MLKGKKLLWSLLFATLLICAACSDDSAKEKASDVDYKTVLDEKFAKTEQRQIRVTTEATDKKDFEAITEELMDQYKGKGLDSIHLYIHSPADRESDKKFGKFKAHSFIALTTKGAIQTGLEKADTYKIETE